MAEPIRSELEVSEPRVRPHLVEAPMDESSAAPVRRSVGRWAGIGAAVGFLLVTTAVAAFVLTRDEGGATAAALGAYVGAFAGAGFGCMLGAVLALALNEADDE